MSHLIPRESWTDREGVRGIAYFCGVLPESRGEAAPGAAPEAAAETPSEATERAKSNAIEFLERDLHALWPAAGGASASASFDWSLLAAPEGHSGRDRFDFQYWRANATASERYVLTTAGSVQHRLPSDRSGFENLVLAGDWTKNGIDGGCVEAAVVSGMQAARGLIDVDRPILGESPGWIQPQAQALPPYVEYGGRATSPGPFLSEGGRLRGFLLEGDKDRIGELVQRTLNAPAGRGNDYRALGSRVLLLVGGFDRVSSLTSPFDRWGTVREIQASFWVPVVAGHDRGDVFVAERVGLAVPYIFVDNPMSYLGGHELYGYAKTMARFEPAGGIGERMRLETYGGNFGRNEGADWHPILEIAPAHGPDGSGNGEALDGPADLVRHLAGDLLQRNAEGEVVLPGIRLTATLLDDLSAGRLRQVFLKQFRDAADGGRACYQSVVEAPIEMLRGGIRPSGREWDVKIHPLDSHPIQQEIGVASQPASVAFDGQLDMVVKNGIEIGTVAASTGVPVAVGESPIPGGVPGDGVIALIEGTARWIHRELSSLGARLTR
jgi:flavin-dependent amine oxidoreductase